jgi:hypothetical protein
VVVVRDRVVVVVKIVVVVVVVVVVEVVLDALATVPDEATVNTTTSAAIGAARNPI